MALAVYFVSALEPSWARAPSGGVSQALAGLRSFFGVWVGFRVKAREGKEVKCLQGPLGLGPSHPPTSGAGQGQDTPGLCKRDSLRPIQPGLGEGHTLAAGHLPWHPLPGRLQVGWVDPAGDTSIQS